MTLGLADIGAEAIVLAGGGRAILLQLAHPAVGRGVAAHSDFANRPYDRLRGTLTYLYAIASDDPADAAEVRRRVNRAHRPVRGDAGDTGDAPAYNAFDPELQLWVAATLYDSAVQIHERIFGPLDAASADRLYREFVVVGTTLQMPAELWPADREAFDAYWRSMLPKLRVTADSRAVARDLLIGVQVPPVMRAIMPLARLATVALLPAELRAPFGLRLTERNRRRFERWISLVSTVYPMLPARLRHAPHDRMLRTLRSSRFRA